MAQEAESADGVKKRRDWLVSRVPSDNFVKEDELISASCYQHGIPWKVGKDDLRIMIGIGKLVALETDEEFSLVRQVWLSGPRLEAEKERRAENERKALEIFASLSSPNEGTVERRAFDAELLKAKFARGEAFEMIRTLFRKGYIYESKGGLLKRLSPI